MVNGVYRNMTQIYLLSGIPAVDDLRLRVSAILEEVGRIKVKANKIRQELCDIQTHLRQLAETIDTLRSGDCKIVSIDEYYKLVKEMDKAKALEVTTRRLLLTEDQLIDRLVDSVTGMEQEIERLQEMYGKVLEFKSSE